jgi:hypothetical protein
MFYYAVDIPEKEAADSYDSARYTKQRLTELMRDALVLARQVSRKPLKRCAGGLFSSPFSITTG